MAEVTSWSFCWAVGSRGHQCWALLFLHTLASMSTPSQLHSSRHTGPSVLMPSHAHPCTHEYLCTHLLKHHMCNTLCTDTQSMHLGTQMHTGPNVLCTRVC